MKIAFFSDCYLDLTGGITSSINAQKAELERRGHTVYVFSSSFPKSEKEISKLAKNNIFPVPSCKIFFRGFTPVSRRPSIIEKWLKRTHPELESFDVFYIHYESGCSIAGLRLAKQLGIPSIQVMHGREDMGEQNIIPYGLRTLVAANLNWFHSWYIPHRVTIKRDDYLANKLAGAKMWTLMVNHANAADLVLTPSNHFREKLLHYGVKKPIKVLPNGVLDSYFIKDISPRSLEEGEELKIIWHSRMSAEKRMMPFLKAIASVKPKYHVDVYGGGGDYFRAKRFARHHKLNVTFHGNKDFATIYRKILTSHLDVLVSYNFDTFGLTLIEAESAGTPVLFVDPDMEEIVPKGSFVLADTPGSDSIAKAIDYLIDHPSQISKMSACMLEHRDEVRVSKRMDELERIIAELSKDRADKVHKT